MAATPQFASGPKLGIATVSTANTNLNGSGTLATVLSAGTGGTKIIEVTVQAAGTVTSGMVRLFVFDGTTNYLFDEIPVSAAIPSASSTAYRTYRIYDNFVLPSGYSLRASTSNAETFNIMAWGGDL
jgi:hypothetical protein